MTASDSHDVLIVGGGLAGLCCARYLHQHGMPIRLFEQADRLGGRVRTDSVEGFRLDRGFQVLLTAYQEASRILDYNALQLQPFYPGAVIRFGGRFHLVGDPFRRPLDLPSTLRSPVGSLSDKVRVAVLRVRLQRLRAKELFDQSDLPTADWLKQQGFSEAMIDRFYRPFLGGVFLEPNLQTTARMARFVLQTFAAGTVAVPSEGMESIPRQLAEELPSSAIHLGTRVETADRCSVTLAGGHRLSGAAVVIATDQVQASKLVPDAPSRDWNPVSCLYFDAPRSPTTRPILMLNGDRHGSINNLHVPSRVTPACAPPDRSLISVTVLNGPADVGELESTVHRELTEWFGEQVGTWRHLRTYRIPHALPTQPPGSVRSEGQPVQTAGGLYVCGDYLQHASIEGAMISGRRAAEAILADQTGGRQSA